MLDQNTSCVFTNVTNNMNDASTNTSHNIMIQAKVILTMHLESANDTNNANTTKYLEQGNTKH